MEKTKECDKHPSPDHFVVKDGAFYAGHHLIVDLWQCQKLDCLQTMERSLRHAAEAARATILHLHLHHFSPNGGITGVLVLAESHITVHTWPEHSFAAFDVFMCGDSKPHTAVEVLLEAFSPKHHNIQDIQRGLCSSPMLDVSVIYDR